MKHLALFVLTLTLQNQVGGLIALGRRVFMHVYRILLELVHLV